MRINYYIQSHGILSRKENTLYFIKKSEDNEIKKIPIPIEKVFAIFCYGRVTLSSGSIYILSKYNIPVHFFNKYGLKIGTYFPRPKKVSGRVLLAQVSYYLDNLKRIGLARTFVKGALSNILINMKYYRRTCQEIFPLEEKVQNIYESTRKCKYCKRTYGN